MEYILPAGTLFLSSLISSGLAYKITLNVAKYYIEKEIHDPLKALQESCNFQEKEIEMLSNRVNELEKMQIRDNQVLETISKNITKLENQISNLFQEMFKLIQSINTK